MIQPIQITHDRYNFTLEKSNKHFDFNKTNPRNI